MSEGGERRSIWSYGGGVQSVAMACLIADGRLPTPDLAVIADTGREAETTWAYLETYVKPMLPFSIQVAGHSLASVDLYRGEKLLIPAWTKSTGKWGRLPTYCSNEWKRRVVMRWLRTQGVKQADLWLGITVDEAHRMKDSDVAWMSHRYPLIDLLLKRRDCYDIIRAAGLPEPCKSSCWMCPHRGRKEWAMLTPGDVQRAKDFDAAIKERDADVTAFRPEVDAEHDICDGGFCWT